MTHHHAHTSGYMEGLLPVSEAVKFLSPHIPDIDITHLLSDLRRGRNRHCGYIPYEVIGRQVYYRRRDLLALIGARKPKPRKSKLKKLPFDQVPFVLGEVSPPCITFFGGLDAVTLSLDDAVEFAREILKVAECVTRDASTRCAA